MKRLSPRWACLVQPPRNPRLSPVHATFQQVAFLSHETDNTTSRWQRRPRPRGRPFKARHGPPDADADAANKQEEESTPLKSWERPNAPSHAYALSSAKLAALHARLSLPSKFPLQTLARCLIHPSADGRAGFNNTPFAILGEDLLGYYTTEWLLCHYPRLPTPILLTAQYAYCGLETLGDMRKEWGVEVVAAPGPEVDPGLLQLARVEAGNAMSQDGMTLIKNLPSAKRINGARRSALAAEPQSELESREGGQDEGDISFPSDDEKPFSGAPISTPGPDSVVQAEQAAEDLESAPEDFDVEPASPSPESKPRATYSKPTTVQAASASFIRALLGALYVHAGSAATKKFHRDHVLSRQLPLHKLFHFNYPTRDLSRLCAREGFEPPVARLISETGRHSRTPVFVVGVFSGNDKLGEAAGASLDEGRVRAAAAALRAWYLYSPPEDDVMLPSETEEGAFAGYGEKTRRRKWKPQLIDIGEVIT